MKRILLAHSNNVFSDEKQTQKMQPYPPLQTLIAAAVLQQAGFEVAVFDPALSRDARGEFVRMLASFEPETLFVCEDDFNFLTKMCLGQNRELAFFMAKEAKGCGIPAFAHGHDASENAAAYLDAGYDGVIDGEVEAALIEVVSGTAVEKVAGAVWLQNGVVHRNQKRAVRSDLDALPEAAWELADIDSYRRAWVEAHGYFSLNMVTSRGCPYQCNWCAKPVYGDSYHVRSARRVASEMRLLKDRYAPGEIWFADDIFALSHRWTAEFCSAVAELDASIPFRMQSRCDLMTRDTVAALRGAGLREVWMGAESGSQKILDAMDKGIRVPQIHQARENLRRNGVRACYFIQFGYPGERWDEIEATVRMVRETQPDDIGVSVSYPLPGTRFHSQVSAGLGEKSNWRDSSDLTMLFRGTYSTVFYRALADALRLEVRGAGHTTLADAWSRVYRLRDAEAPASAAPLPQVAASLHVLRSNSV